MRMTFGEVLEIQDLGDHPVGPAVSLGILLAGPTDVTPDPKRKDFYEVEDGSITYYIHVSPVTGIIYLLATWQNAATHGAALHAAVSVD